MSDYLYVGRMEQLPRNKHGDKKGYFPARPKPEHIRGQSLSWSKSRQSKSGHIVSNFAPMHSGSWWGFAPRSRFSKWKPSGNSTVFDKGVTALVPIKKGQRDRYMCRNRSINL